MKPEHELLNRQMLLMDKKLYHLNEEMLYYVIKRAESILNFRAEQDLKDANI